ncbi:myelin expression factor 2-like isoform X2, partial [Biomphalaria glabrata]
IIEFKDPDDAKKAIALFHKKIINERVIFIREDLPQDHLARGRQTLGLRKCPGVASVDLSGGSLDPVELPTELTNIVFVANLHYSVSQLQLKSLFKLAGHVMKAEIKVDSNGKSRGMGRVHFRHPMEADQAV